MKDDFALDFLQIGAALFGIAALGCIFLFISPYGDRPVSGLTALALTIFALLFLYMSEVVRERQK